MKKYKHKITGDVVTERKNIDCRFYTNEVHSIPALFVENSNDWEEVKEVEKLCVPIGTKFTHGNGETIFTISRVYGIEVDVTWNNGELPSFYNIKQVNSLFSNGTWKIYVEKPVLFVTEDGKEIREGDSYYYVYSDFMVDFSSSACKTSGTTGCKYFSTKELAQEYSDMNKPIYSKRQIIEALQRMDLVTRRVCNVPSFYEKFLL